MESLASLCRSTIAIRLEKYPPSLLGILSESEWEHIVELKYNMTSPNQHAAATAHHHHRLVSADSRSLSDGRIIPAISADIMNKIETWNPHLASSSLTDELVWKDCVNYKFRCGGSTRPVLLQIPWPMLVQKAKHLATELLQLTLPPTSKTTAEDITVAAAVPAASSSSSSSSEIQTQDSTNPNPRTETLYHDILPKIEALPMSKPLLEQSDIGKALHEFIKKCHKVRKILDSSSSSSYPTTTTTTSSSNRIDYNYFPNVWTKHFKDGEYKSDQDTVITSILERLISCLQGWKQMVVGVGVGIKKDDDDHPLPALETKEQCEYTGKTKKTTLEQYQTDLQLVQSCMQWRDLYTTLTQRMKDKMIQHGQRMRQLREDEKSIHRPNKVGLVSIRTTKTIEKREAILSGALGTKHHLQSISSSSSSSNGKNKLQQLRKEVAAASSRMQRMIQPVDKNISTVQVGGGRGSFSASIANVAKIPFNPRRGVVGGVVATASLSSKHGFHTLPSLSSSKKKTHTISLDDGKRMTIPNPVWKGGGGDDPSNKKPRLK